MLNASDPELPVPYNMKEILKNVEELNEWIPWHMKSKSQTRVKSQTCVKSKISLQSFWWVPHLKREA